VNPLLEEIRKQPKGFTATEFVNLIMKVEQCHITEAYSIRDRLVESGEMIQIENFNPVTRQLRIPWESKQKVWYVLNNLRYFRSFLISLVEGTWKVKRFYPINTALPIKVVNKLFSDEDRRISEEDLEKIYQLKDLIIEPFKKLKELLDE